MTRVAIILKANGDTDWCADGPVELLIIDENNKRDRVYAPRVESFVVAPERVDELIGDSRIGRLGDMPVTEAAVRAYLDGVQPPARRPLQLVAGAGDAPRTWACGWVSASNRCIRLGCGNSGPCEGFCK